MKLSASRNPFISVNLIYAQFPQTSQSPEPKSWKKRDQTLDNRIVPRAEIRSSSYNSGQKKHVNEEPEKSRRMTEKYISNEEANHRQYDISYLDTEAEFPQIIEDNYFSESADQYEPVKYTGNRNNEITTSGQFYDGENYHKESKPVDYNNQNPNRLLDHRIYQDRTTGTDPNYHKRIYDPGRRNRYTDRQYYVDRQPRPGSYYSDVDVLYDDSDIAFNEPRVTSQPINRQLTSFG